MTNSGATYIRHLYLRTVIAFLLIAITFALLTSQKLHTAQVTLFSAQTLNNIGRLRMRSQRIAWLANTPSMRVDGTTNLLIDSAERMENRYAELRKIMLAMPGLTGDKGLENASFLADLERQINTYVADAHLLAKQLPSEAPDHDALERINLAARGPLLDDLEKMVSLYQDSLDLSQQHLKYLLAGSFFVILLALGIIYTLLLHPVIRRVSFCLDELHRLATTDTLTGIASRRSFMEHLSIAMERYRRYHTPLSIISMDIDHFKHVNDSFGHECGDQVLICVAQTIHRLVRSTDLFGRIGGEEFCLLLPNTELPDAELLAERIRTAVEESVLTYHDQPVKVTISLGLTAASGESQQIDHLLSIADQALYHSKHTGRNRYTMQTY